MICITSYDLYYRKTLIQLFYIHVGTNNCVNQSCRVVLHKILNLKIFMQNSLPQCKLIIFTVIGKTMMLKRVLQWKT